MLHWCVIPVLASVVAGAVLHFLVRKITSNPTIITHVDEFVGNVVSSVFILELSVIASVSGSNSLEAVLAGFIHLFFKHVYFMTLKLYGNPLGFVDVYYSNNKRNMFSFSYVITILVTQVCAVLVGQRFSKFMWSFEDSVHINHLQYACMTTLSPHYTWQYATALEGLGVFVSLLIDFCTPNSPYVVKPIVRSIVTLSLLWNLSHISGLWMNPLLASVFTFRCKGHRSDWQHFAVYWTGPAIGFVLAWELKFLYGSISGRKQSANVSNGVVADKKKTN